MHHSKDVSNTKGKVDLWNTIKVLEHQYKLKKTIGYDIVLFLTGEENLKSKNLVSTKGKVCALGINRVGKNFKKANIIIQDHGTYSGIKMAVNSFGRMLGSPIDGTGASANCPSKDRYIMSNEISIEKGKRNAHKWSSCSKSAIKEYTKKSKCLHNQPASGDTRFHLLEWTEMLKNNIIPNLNKQCNIYKGNKESFFMPFLWIL